ncbi:MAG: hypothetical protein U1F81_20970 [Verrucomicrobiaceae bacterium]
MTHEARKAYEVVLRRIHKAKNQSSLWLQRGGMEALFDLRNLGLTEIPPEIGQLTDLKQLNLTGNSLTHLPSEIGHLTALSTLNLTNNPITCLPPEIGQLTSLSRLELYGGKLTTLPPEIGQLSALTRLGLSGNQLTKLPLEIGLLSALTTLDLSYNSLAELPPQIGQTTDLTTLNLCHNRLKTLPQEIGGLKRLKRLLMENNKLGSLPHSLLKLKNLQEITLHGNKALGLPSEMLGPRYAASGSDSEGAANPQDILAAYFTHRQAVEAEGTEPLMEAKVLVLGEASVGKSCLIAALSKGKRRTELDGKGTSGIVRRLWEVPVKGEGIAPNPKTRGVETLRLNCEPSSFSWTAKVG